MHLSRELANRQPHLRPTVEETMARNADSERAVATELDLFLRWPL